MNQSGMAATIKTTGTNPGMGQSSIKRLLSLDVVRGLTIAFMIMVNNNGGSGSWRFMNHAEWNGLTPTDLVFPTFLFVVGVSVVFAFEARLARGATRSELARHTAQRAVILMIFGIIVNSFPFFELPHMRFYGVLQRIAVCYLCVALFYLWDRRIGTKVAALAVVLLGYWALLWWVPIPGAGMPGKDVPFLDHTQNIVSYVDRTLMPHHLYLNGGNGPDSHNTRDPEGLLSDIPALGTTLLGLLTGLWLRSERAARIKFAGLAAGAAACLALGYLWSLWFPLNKNMWTSSYVLVAAGYSLIVLTIAYWAVELKGWRSGWTWPWLVFGSNAIVAYMISELGASLFWVITVPVGSQHVALQPYLFQHIFAPIPDPHWAAFGWSVSFTALCFLPTWLLYRKKIFLKV